MRRTAALLALPAVVVLAATVTASPAAAQDHNEHGDTSQGEPGEHSIALEPLNESGAGGTAVLTLTEDGSLEISIEADGLAPGQPHAQHIHGDTDLTQDFTCPGPEADADGDGFVNVAEGVPSYGNIHISLTTEGDTTPDSGLAVDRMPAADDDGRISYSRTLTADQLPQGTAAAIRNLHVVLHGIDINDNGEYDFDANGESELDPEIPFEATVPAACGIVSGADVEDLPQGGVDTGAGPLAGTAPAEQITPVVWQATAAGAALALGLTLFGLRHRLRGQRR